MNRGSSDRPFVASIGYSEFDRRYWTSVEQAVWRAASTRSFWSETWARIPEIRRLNSGERVVNLRMATSETWRDKNSGERKEKTEWHRVVIFNDNLAKVAEQYLKKGIEGLHRGPVADAQVAGPERPGPYTTEVVLQKFRGELQMLDSRGGGDAQAGYSGGQGRGGADFGGEDRAARGGAPRSGGSSRDLDDEIPF